MTSLPRGMNLSETSSPRALSRDGNHQPIRVDVLVAIAGVVRRGSRVRIEIARGDVAVVGPGDVNNMLRFPGVPTGGQLDVVPVEANRTVTEHAAVGIVRR